MKRAAKAPATALIAEAAALTRLRQRLARLLVAGGPILAAVATAALGILPAWVGTLVALVALAWAVIGLGGDRSGDLEAARRIDERLGAKETFLTWATVPESARGPLWPIVARRATDAASGHDARPFAAGFEWRRPLASVAASLALVGLVALFVRLRPVEPTAELVEIAERLEAPGRDAASRALAAELRALAEKLADPNVAAEEKREMAKEMREKLERQAQQQKGSQGSSGGQGQANESKGEQTKGAGTKGDAEGEEKGSGERSAAAAALGKIEEELAGESTGEKESQAKEKGEGQGGGVQGPSEGRKAGEKAGEGEGNQPGPKEDGGKSESGEGEGGRQSKDKPDGRQPENQQSQAGQSPSGSGEGSGAAGKASLEDTGQKAERYYRLGEGSDALRVEDGRYVRVLVPEQDAGVGTERVQKPGEVSPETPFGNAPLPSEGRPGEAEERQPLPLEYRPIFGRQEK